MLTAGLLFLPLMLVSGPMGKILGDIPFIMICVLLASVIECFFILPAHLRKLEVATSGSAEAPWPIKLSNRLVHVIDELLSAM